MVSQFDVIEDVSIEDAAVGLERGRGSVLIQPVGRNTSPGLPFPGCSVVLFERFALESGCLGLNPNSITYLFCDLGQIT